MLALWVIWVIRSLSETDTMFAVNSLADCSETKDVK